MKIYNKSNYNVMIKGSLLAPQSVSIEYPDSYKEDPEIKALLDKGWIEIFDPKKHNNIKQQTIVNKVSFVAEKPSVEVKENSTINKVEYIYSGEIGDDDAIVKGDASIAHGQSISNNLNNITLEDSLNVSGPDLSAEALNKNLVENSEPYQDIKTADQYIEEEYAKVVKSEGKMGARVVNVRQEIETQLNAAAETLKSIDSVVSLNVKDFLKKPAHEKRLIISQTNDSNFLEEVKKLEKSNTIKQLATQRLKELQKERI